jgi:steroid delta-isomerase-like uncharacterized protein
MKNLAFFLFCTWLLASCGDMSKGTAAHDKSANNKQRMQQFYDQVINAHNVNAIDSFCTADFVDHNPDEGFTGKGVADLKASFKAFFTAFPDIHITTHFMVAEGDTIAAHVNLTGTNSGAMGPGMPATNKKISVDGIDMVAVKDGKATERWGFFDTRKMMTDLGMMGGAPADTTKMEKK